jgi:hypothetical protein
VEQERSRDQNLRPFGFAQGRLCPCKERRDKDGGSPADSGFWDAMLQKAESLQVKSPSGRRSKSPAFENREDRGSLSRYGVGRIRMGRAAVVEILSPLTGLDDFAL